ncbi:helix-turn-helix domain-containing protein [Oceaniglobus trochenteri]|uniref:helix-turn-helix domain-containing protein n=1 Tax=Oceaniglobus trochenteri TaxID=2763260 RepID=UPI001CFFA0CB|nr:helix-turn-helix transcriptional regulator [Oceaniglobus trochenteri]
MMAIAAPNPAQTDSLLAQRIRHIMDLCNMSARDLADASGLPFGQVIDIIQGHTPVTLAQSLAISRATGHHIMAFIDGIDGTPAFIHPSLMDREAGDLALRLMRLPKVGRAMALALAEKETSCR